MRWHGRLDRTLDITAGPERNLSPSLFPLQASRPQLSDALKSRSLPVELGFGPASAGHRGLDQSIQLLNTK